jgi:hypothetical protein
MAGEGGAGWLGMLAATCWTVTAALVGEGDAAGGAGAAAVWGQAAAVQCGGCGRGRQAAAMAGLGGGRRDAKWGWGRSEYAYGLFLGILTSRS